MASSVTMYIVGSFMQQEYTKWSDILLSCAKVALLQHWKVEGERSKVKLEAVKWSNLYDYQL